MIRKARNVRHMNAAAHHASTLFYRLERQRNEGADRSEDDGGIERLRRHLVRPAGPYGTQRFCEGLRGLVSAPGKRMNTAALRDCYLRENVRRGAETVDAERASFAC